MTSHPLKIETTTDICALVRGDHWRMEMLGHARSLNLPDWAIGAGFVRAVVWDTVTGRGCQTILPDLDLIYFDPDNTNPERDETLRQRVCELSGTNLWDVKNQARMHLKNTDPPYRNTEDALANWLEVPTCVAMRLEENNSMTLLAPHGIDDLLALRVRPTPAGERYPHKYRARMKSKRWDLTWPGMTIEDTAAHLV